jgi:hypothetical protein
MALGNVLRTAVDRVPDRRALVFQGNQLSGSPA